MSARARTIRVLVAEDSPLFAEAIQEVFAGDRELEVVAVAADGRQAVELTHRLRPDVVTMDVHMPVLDGLTAISRIMSEQPTPILVMTGDPRGETGELAFEALRRGALDLVQKPVTWPVPMPVQERLREHVKLLASVRVVRHMSGSERQRSLPPQPPTRTEQRIVGVAASTGGPPALARVLSALPEWFPWPIVVVQHIAPSFVHDLCRWLDSSGPLPVGLARDGERVRGGRVYLAPDGLQLGLDRTGTLRLEVGALVDGHRPSATYMLKSLARSYGRRSVGVVLTGMGRDGASGLLEIRRAGGTCIAQDEASSAVFGMPRAAIESSAAQFVLSLDEVGRFLRQLPGTEPPVRGVHLP